MMKKIELHVLFKKIQKDDKKEVLEFHILSDEIPHKSELIGMAGGIAILEVEGTEKLTAEFKSIQKDSKKAALKFEAKGDNNEKIVQLYRLAGSNVKLNLEESQMSIDEFYDEDEHEGLEYNLDKNGTVEVVDGQITSEEVLADDEPLLQ
ncbi:MULTISPECIES: hypothetical protein [unclassified Sporosarcina]|uniref:hypothetical protein n=1 Tax=unclassified Sporosarcina TaxID=2647733 RepID=UPI00208998E9|nr:MULTISPECIES: hypothetical protein [unclassified Sporosarcina]GKV66712.1 hypothetical protein NCCP2331_28650 [Sporosarcina sp. NCCP-2331]GLB57105.1 hypothetical protein NCCP2378_28920 [Sporosarcina sp. NCCP-2378]